MRLYYAPGACSLAPHIVLEELQLVYRLLRVDLKTKKLTDGSSFEKVNPKGAVPTIETDKEGLLTENAAILQYLAAQSPKMGLAIPEGEEGHYRFLEWLNYIATELHKGYAPIFHGAPEEYQAVARKKLEEKYDYLSQSLKGKAYLMGDRYTVADAYLFTILNWSPKAKIDLAKFPVLYEYSQRVRSRPATEKALRAEGL